MKLTRTTITLKMSVTWTSGIAIRRLICKSKVAVKRMEMCMFT